MHAKHPFITGAPAPTSNPTPAPVREGLATPAQACAFLAVSRQYLWLRARAGQIQPVKFGRLVRYKWSDLEAVAVSGFPAHGSAK